AVRVRVVDLGPNRDDHYDLSEFLAGATTANERREAAELLRTIAASTPLYVPRSDAANAKPVGGVAQGVVGVPHADVLALRVPPANELVESIAEAGTVGSIIGLPELFKSWIGADMAHKVAAGGRVFGRFSVRKTGPVAYVWQDDSRENEVRRVQAYANRHGYTDALPIRWYLNEGVALPGDIEVLRAEVEHYGFV